MKDRLQRKHFPNNDADVQAVKLWATSAGANFYECGMQALIHRWRKCIANGGDCVEKSRFVAKNTLSNSVIVLFLSIAVSMEINRRH
jgi:hypothetical protein